MPSSLLESAESLFGELVIEEVLDLLIDVMSQCQLVSRVLVYA